VAYAWNGGLHDNSGQDNFDIYVQVAGSGSPVRLTTDPAIDARPAWSPDGRQIAFLRFGSDSQGIYVIPPLGGRERKVLDVPGISGATLSWTPQGTSLVFGEIERKDSGVNLYELVLASGEKRRLATPPPGMVSGDVFGVVSPDGETLAFGRGTRAQREIYLMPMKGGEPRALPSRGGAAYGLAWTPDSREIVYSWSPSLGAGRSLWRIAVDGGEPRPLPSLAGAGDPVISLRGNRLAYESSSYDANIWRYSLAAGKDSADKPVKIVDSTFPDTEPRISPDGGRIAFASIRSGNREIWTCDRDGSNLLRLTSYGKACGSPRWSPDGRRIAFDSDVQGNWDVFVVNADGGAPRALTQDPAEDSRPSWSRDGRWIYYGSNRGGDYQIWKVAAEGGEPVQVTRDGGYNPVESPDGRLLYFGKGEGKRGLWKMPVEGGEETAVLPELQAAGGGGQWDIADNGVYFVGFAADPALGEKWVLRLLSFDSGETTTVMELPTGLTGPSLDIAPDGRSFVCAQVDQLGADLMLVEGFR
jgi:Tol biopolymer transport system component